MRMQDFYLEVQQHLEYLADGTYSYDEYLQMSINNRRVRNAFVFYTLSNKEYLNRFRTLAKSSWYVCKLRNHLHKGLVKVTLNDLNREEVIFLAKQFLQLHFREESVVVDTTVYDASDEMAKFFSTVVNRYYINLEITDETRAYVENLLKGVTRENLFD